MTTMLEELEDRVEFLTAEVERLKAYFPAVATPASWGLSRSENIIFLAILNARAVCSREMVLRELYPMPDDGPEDSTRILDVFMIKMRRKVEPHGVKISTVWGRGWILEDRDMWVSKLSVGGNHE